MGGLAQNRIAGFFLAPRVRGKLNRPGLRYELICWLFFLPVWSAAAYATAGVLEFCGWSKLERLPVAVVAAFGAVYVQSLILEFALKIAAALPRH